MTQPFNLRPALDKLTSTGIQRSKQESTILAIIDKYVTGAGFDNRAFWRRDDTAAKSTYKKWRKHDPAFVAVLEECKSLVRSFRSQHATQAVEEALVTLQLAAPEAAEKVQALLRSDKETVALKASFGILDRASALTSTKGQHQVNVPGLDEALSKIYGDDEEE